MGTKCAPLVGDLFLSYFERDSFGDLHSSPVSSKIYDKRDDFDFEIVNFPFLDGDEPRSTSYGVYISLLVHLATFYTSTLCNKLLTVSVPCTLVITCWERADLLALLCCVFVTFPYGVPGQVWYSVVSFPDLCLPLYFVRWMFSFLCKL